MCLGVTAGLPRCANWRRSGLTSRLNFVLQRATGIEPASRAWEPYNDALVPGLTCGLPWSGVNPVDRC